MTSLAKTFSIAQFVYSRIASLKGGDNATFEKRQLLRLRKLLLKFNDPIVAMPVGPIKLSMRLSHNQPYLRSNSPFYDEVLSRLVLMIESARGPLTMIDVGANVGDTVALVYSSEPRQYLCIEGDPRHFAFLKENMGNKSNVECLQEILSDQAGLKLGFNEHQGTSHVSIKGKDVGATSTLDETVKRHPRFANCNFLKIDTDGFDLKILRGTKQLLSIARPVILIELSPRHYRAVGAESPSELWEFLADAGYRYIVIYTSRGILIGATDIEARSTRDLLADMVRHADYEGRYYDVAAFSSEDKSIFDKFSVSERALFAPPPVGSFNI